MRRIVVNGRFFAQPRTGVQRYGLETLRALDQLLTRHPQFLESNRWELALPHDAVDVPLLENFEYCTLQFFTGHAWEQLSLAAFARGAYLVNLNYSAPLLKRYKENLNAYCGKLRDFCARRGMMHVTVDTSTDLTVLLMDYLRKRGLLK